MRKATKVLMFVWRKGEKGEAEFLVLKRREQKDCVVLTGHVGDVFPDESLQEAVAREIKEELNIEPVNIADLDFVSEVKIKDDNVLSREHGFLAEVLYEKETRFLEYEAEIIWLSLPDLEKALTYKHQKETIKIIKDLKNCFCHP